MQTPFHQLFRSTTVIASVFLLGACGGRASTETSSQSGHDDDTNETDETDNVSLDAGTDTPDGETDAGARTDPMDADELAELDAGETGTGETDPPPEDGPDAQETDASPTDAPEETDPPPSPSNAPLWVYMSTPSHVIMNVNAPSQRFVGLNTVSQEDQNMKPWSPDGRWLADSTTGTLLVYDLASGEVWTEIEVEGISRVLGWLGADFVVAEVNGGAGLIGLDGSVLELVPPPEMQSVTGSSASLDGNFFAYYLGGGSGYPFYIVDASDKAMPGPPSLIDDYGTAPAISLVWSPTSSWLAYGVPNTEGGIYLFNPTTGDPPLRISPPDASYTPLHSFSPSGEGLVSYVTGADGPLLLHAHVDGDAVGAITQLSQATDQSPAYWAPEGDYLHYSSEGTGWLHPIDSTNVELERHQVPGYNYGCTLRWVDGDTFVYQTCMNLDPTLQWTSAESPSSATTLPLTDVSSFEIAGPCLIAWNDTTFLVGNAEVSADYTEFPSLSMPVQQVALEPNGAGIAWTARGLMFWQPLADCKPVGETTLISPDGEVQWLEFLPRQN